MLKRNLNNKNEADLLVLFYEKNDSKALGTLLNRYLPMILAISNHYMKNKTKAQDASSEVLEKMIKYFHAKRVDNPKALIAISTKNHCLNLLNSTKPRVDEQSVLDRLKAESELDEKIAKESTYEQLDSCLNELKSTQAESLKLFYFQNKTYQEVAEQMNLEVKQVKSEIQNGKRMLRNLMLKNGDYGRQ